MKLAVVVGTRPEIVKMAPIVRAADDAGVACTLLHTGQHYSFEMDGIFFDELGLRAPDVNLEVGSASHPQQLARMIAGFEAALLEAAPDWVLVEGDTNSVLAAGLTANKLGLRVAHVEAGLRSRDRSMPEEINRILVDHLADDLLAPTDVARENLLDEGLPAFRIAVTGNTVVDEVLRHVEAARRLAMPERFGLRDGGYLLATVHRAENVDDELRLRGILEGLGRVARTMRAPLLLALHPRTSRRIAELNIGLDELLRPLPPLGYLEFLGLHLSAKLLLTDSGGLQEEACTLRVPCVVLRDSTERPEAIEVGAARLAGADASAIENAAIEMIGSDRGWPNPFGNGTSGQAIVARYAAPAAAMVPLDAQPIPVADETEVASSV